MNDATHDLSTLVNGVIPPIATPLRESGELDLDALRNLRDSLARAGVKGIFALGSTGESSYLTDADRLQVVRTLSENGNADLPLLVGIVEPTAKRIVEAAKPLLEHPVAAVVVTGPFYALASEGEIFDHFESVASRLAVPVIAYNIPPNVGYPLPTRVVQKLVREHVIAGIKDSSSDLGGMRQLIDASGDSDALFLTGSDLLLDGALHIGANGAVAGLANVAPELFVAALAAHKAGEFARLAEIQRKITILTDLYANTEPTSGINSTQIGSIKTALKLRGFINDDTVSEPMRSSSLSRREYVRGVLTSAGVPMV